MNRAEEKKRRRRKNMKNTTRQRKKRIGVWKLVACERIKTNRGICVKQKVRIVIFVWRLVLELSGRMPAEKMRV